MVSIQRALIETMENILWIVCSMYRVSRLSSLYSDLVHFFSIQYSVGGFSIDPVQFISLDDDFSDNQAPNASFSCFLFLYEKQKIKSLYSTLFVCVCVCVSNYFQHYSNFVLIKMPLAIVTTEM